MVDDHISTDGRSDTSPDRIQLVQTTRSAFGDAIGGVRGATGQILIVHSDGTSEPAEVGLPVFANDIVATGADSAVEVVFLDGTTFSLGGNGQMRLDSLVYDPAGSSNALDATIVKGAFVFVTGNIGSSRGEGVVIDTPAGTIGIRGTSGAVKEDPQSGAWIFTLLRDPDGTLSRFTVSNAAGVQILDQEFETTQVASRQLAPSQTFVLSPEQAGALFNDALRMLEQQFPQLQSPEQRGEHENIVPAAGGEGIAVEQGQPLPIPQALIDVYGLELALSLADLLAALGLDATELQFVDIGGSPVPIFVPEAPGTPLVDSDVTTPNQVATNIEAGGYVGLTVQPNTPIVNGAIVFSLLDDADGQFAIDPETGQVTLTSHLDPGSYIIVARATDSDGDFADTAFKITVVPDAVPRPADDSVSTEDRVGQTINLVIVIDTSGSMGTDPGVDGFATRLDLARAAIAALFAAHGSAAQLNIQIIGFADSATASGWFDSIEEANAFLAGLVSDGGTNYAAGILATMAAFDDAPPADKAEVYFLSDGTPSPGTSLAAVGLVGAWEDFVADPANDIAHAFAVGIGGGLQPNDPDLADIAFPNNDSQTRVTVSNEADLVDTLVSTTVNPVSGNVLTNDGFGADGPAAQAITQLQHGDEVFTRGATGGDVISNDGQVILIRTDLGGTLQFNFDTGDFTYTPPDVTGSTAEDFTYTIVDGDGSTASATLHIAISDAGIGSTNAPIVAAMGEAVSRADSYSLSVADVVAIDHNGDLFNDNPLNANALPVSFWHEGTGVGISADPPPPVLID